MLESLAAENFFVKDCPPYQDVFQLHSLFDKQAFKADTILSGPKGIAKSLSLENYAFKHKMPLVSFSCSEDVRRSHLLGNFIIKGGETPFIMGPIPTAFKIANEIGKCILLLEEINTLTPQVQKVLNSVTDFHRKIEITEVKTIFKLKEGASLWVTGTMNPSYTGTFNLNEDLKSRFRILPLNYPEIEQEKEIIRELLADIIVEESYLSALLELALESRNNLEYALSTRDIVQIIQDSQRLGPETALWIASGKFEGVERKTINSRMRSLFTFYDRE